MYSRFADISFFFQSHLDFEVYTHVSAKRITSGDFRPLKRYKLFTGIYSYRPLEVS